MSISDLQKYLDKKVKLYNTPFFIETDPISIPHQFTKKQDIEIAGFLSASIAWGNRKMIIKNARKIINLMDNAPHDFVLNFEDKDLKKFQHFGYRTFKPVDLQYFLTSLQKIYKNHQSMEELFSPFSTNMYQAIENFRKNFLSLPHLPRTEKHIASPAKKSSAKRLNMFLRWMVRKDKSGVDFGIWNSISPKDLLLPLDIHTGNVARKLNLLCRKQNDWKAVTEVTEKLKLFDEEDPVKYDFALFGIGVHEKAV